MTIMRFPEISDNKCRRRVVFPVPATPDSVSTVLSDEFKNFIIDNK